MSHMEQSVWLKVKKVIIGALIAGAGAVLVFLLQWINTDPDTAAVLGAWGPAVGAFISVLINALRKWAESLKEEEEGL